MGERAAGGTQQGNPTYLFQGNYVTGEGHPLKEALHLSQCLHSRLWALATGSSLCGQAEKQLTWSSG